MLVRGRSVGLPPFGAWYHFGIKAAEAFRLSNVVGVVYNTDMGILTVKGCFDDGKEKSTGCRGYDRTGR